MGISGSERRVCTTTVYDIFHMIDSHSQPDTDDVNFNLTVEDVGVDGDWTSVTFIRYFADLDDQVRGQWRSSKQKHHRNILFFPRWIPVLQEYGRRMHDSTSTRKRLTKISSIRRAIEERSRTKVSVTKCPRLSRESQEERANTFGISIRKCVFRSQPSCMLCIACEVVGY